MSDPHLDVDQAVRDRYEQAAQARQEALCCPVDYDPKYLAAIPEEVLEHVDFDLVRSMDEVMEAVLTSRPSPLRAAGDADHGIAIPHG